MSAYQKGVKVQVSENFYSTDFDCHCSYPECNVTLIDSKLIYALEALFLIIGPFLKDSGYRCQQHNKEVGGVGGSYHMKGLAMDVKCEGFSGRQVADAAEKVPGFNNGGIGVALAWAHLDVRGFKLYWFYA